jgi:prepilin-type N-terminal cleavage/methylation domain-containing protein
MSIHREKLKLNNQRGFTLIEVLVALVIVATALVPILTLSSFAKRTSANVRDDLIAAGLSQEGIEVVRAIRDTNWFQSLSFDAGLSDGTYRTEWNSTSLLPAGSSPPLNLNNGLYTYSGGTPTKFSRSIIITKVNANELKVVSQITWLSQSNVTRTAAAEDHLFNWK